MESDLREGGGAMARMVVVDGLAGRVEALRLDLAITFAAFSLHRRRARAWPSLPPSISLIIRLSSALQSPSYITRLSIEPVRQEVHQAVQQRRLRKPKHHSSPLPTAEVVQQAVPQVSCDWAWHGVSSNPSNLHDPVPLFQPAAVPVADCLVQIVRVRQRPGLRSCSAVTKSTPFSYPPSY